MKKLNLLATIISVVVDRAFILFVFSDWWFWSTPTTGICEAMVNTDHGQAVICEKQKRRLRRFTVFFLEYFVDNMVT